MTDRFAEMGATGPCPECGQSGGLPKYRPDMPAPISAEARAAYEAFAAKPEGAPKP